MKLIFVYNTSHTNSGSLLASARKFFNPTKNQCDLCSLTHGVFFEKQRWKTFKKSTDLEMIFLHKDQFLKQYKSKWLPRYNFPVILSQHKGALELFITTADIVKIKDVAGLVAAIKSRI